MMNFILGTLFGIVIATVGLSGIANLFDNGVNSIQETVKEVTK